MLAYNKLNEAIKNKIVEMYKELGYGSQNNISNTLDISRRSVSRVLKESNINTARKNNYTLNESFFSNIINENQSYLLGLIYADGFNGGINHISIDLKDYEHLVKVANILKYTGDITDRTSG
jgi:DNA-binding XRE family transcriptional regulator